MKLDGKKVFVTGADGFIGSHLVERLVRQGIDVHAFVFYNSFNSWGWLDTLSPDVKKSLTVYSGDIRDPHGIKAAMKGCEVVLHLAALIAIPHSYHFPDSYVDTNIKGTLNVLQVARELGIEKFVHTSTSEVYGTAQYVPICEKHPLNAQSPYAATKIAADQLAMSFYYTFGLPVSIIRPFNTYGPRQSARAVIPATIIQLMNENEDIKLGNLTPTRDFNYIDDTVSGFLAIAESEKSIGEVINMSSQFEVSIRETVALIAQLMGREIAIVADAQRYRPEHSEVNRLYASNQKAKALLNWQPQYAGLTGFAKGLERTIAWFRQPENLIRYKADCYNM